MRVFKLVDGQLELAQGVMLPELPGLVEGSRGEAERQPICVAELRGDAELRRDRNVGDLAFVACIEIRNGAQGGWDAKRREGEGRMDKSMLSNGKRRGTREGFLPPSALMRPQVLVDQILTASSKPPETR